MLLKMFQQNKNEISSGSVALRNNNSKDIIIKVPFPWNLKKNVILIITFEELKCFTWEVLKIYSFSLICNQNYRKIKNVIL